MKRKAIPSLALALGACATLHGGADSGALYQQGLEALANRDFATATLQLQHSTQSGSKDIATRSAVLLAAAQMDPANPVRTLDAADGLAARVADADGSATFEQAVAATLERMAGEVAVLKQGLTSAQTQRDSAYATIDRLRVQTDSLSAQRDAARRRTSQLEQSSAELTKELEKKTQEIERIRRAIRR